MKIIGVTGGIGSGKTTVAGILGGLGAAVIDADAIGHRVIDEDLSVNRALVDHFSSSILLPGGRIDRRALAGKVFGTPEELAFVNSVVHPVIRDRVENLIREYRQPGRELVVIDAPLLIEAGWVDLVDYVWVVTAPRNTIMKRLEAKKMSRRQVLSRMKAQVADRERCRLADEIIDNSTDLSSLKIQVSGILQNYLA